MLAISMQLFLMAICSKLCLHFHSKMDLEVSLVKKVYQQVYNPTKRCHIQALPAVRDLAAEPRGHEQQECHDGHKNLRQGQDIHPTLRHGQDFHPRSRQAVFSLHMVIDLVYGDVILTFYQRQTWLS